MAYTLCACAQGVIRYTVVFSMRSDSSLIPATNQSDVAPKYFNEIALTADGTVRTLAKVGFLKSAFCTD